MKKVALAAVSFGLLNWCAEWCPSDFSAVTEVVTDACSSLYQAIDFKSVLYYSFQNIDCNYSDVYIPISDLGDKPIDFEYLKKLLNNPSLLWYELEPVITDYFVFTLLIWVLFLFFYLKPHWNLDLIEFKHNCDILSETTFRLKDIIEKYNIEWFSTCDRDKLKILIENLMNLSETLHDWGLKDKQGSIKQLLDLNNDLQNFMKNFDNLDIKIENEGINNQIEKIKKSLL